jgi:hypothetical protein
VASKKISSKSVNKTSKKKIVASTKDLKKLSKALTTAAKQASRSGAQVKRNQSKLKKRVQSSRSTSSQISRTVKSASHLVNVVRDAFGRFAKQSQKKPSKPNKTKPTTSKSSRQQAKPKKSAKSTPVKNTPTGRRKSVGFSKRDEQRNLLEAKQAYEKLLSEKPNLSKLKTSSKISYSFLRKRKGENTIDFLDRIEANENAIDALKGKDGYWIFDYARGKSRRVYRNIGLAIQRMRQYDLTKQVENEDKDSEIDFDLVRSIKFMVFDGTPLEYVTPNEERVRMRNAERARIRRNAQKMIGGKRQPDFGGSIDLVKRLMEELEKERNKNAIKTKRVPKAKSARKSSAAKKGLATPDNKKSGKSKSKKAIHKKGVSNKRKATTKKNGRQNKGI